MFTVSNFPLALPGLVRCTSKETILPSGSTAGEQSRHLGYDLVKSLITGESDVFVGFGSSRTD